MIQQFIELELGSYTIVHGFDDQQQEIKEEIKVPNHTKKIVAISRIKSISEKYILTDYLCGRWIYWEYKGDFKEIKKVLLNESDRPY